MTVVNKALLIVGGVVTGLGVVLLSASDRRARAQGLGRTVVYGDKGKTGFRIEVGEDEIACFRRRWPASGLNGLRKIFAAFDRGGDLVELECNHIGGSCEKWDGSAIAALTEDMQCAGESFLGIKDRCQSKEWLHCLRD